MFSIGEIFVTKSQKWFFPIFRHILETFSDEKIRRFYEKQKILPFRNFESLEQWNAWIFHNLLIN